MSNLRERLEGKQKEIDLRIKRARLVDLIREIGQMVGENDKFLCDYIDEVVLAWSSELDQATLCFESLYPQAQKIFEVSLASRPARENPKFEKFARPTMVQCNPGGLPLVSPFVMS